MNLQLNENATLQRVVALVIVLCVVIANVFATYSVFTKPFPGHNDFITPWEATRAFWIDGLNPYGEETGDRIQMKIFGREPLPEEDPGYFAYPLYMTYFILPTMYMDYAWASAVWMVFLEVCLVIALFLLFDLFEWFPKPLMLVGMMLWALFFYPAARGLILGQMSHFVYLLQVFVLWSLVRKQETAAGIALGISTLKPQMGYLLIPFLLLWALKTRRIRFIITFIVTFALCLLSAFIIYPDWLSEWLHRLSIYTSYTIASPMWIITQHFLGLGDSGETVLTLVFYGLVLWSWWMVLWENKTERLMWVIMWTLTITHLVAPRTASPHLVLFTIPLLFYVSYWKRFSVKWANWRTGLTLTLFFFLPWIHFLVTVGGTNNEQEGPSTHIVLPLVILGILWFTRQLWWDYAPRFPSQDELKEAQVSTSQALNEGAV